MPRFHFVVSLTTDETDREVVQSYVAEAVGSWCGSYNPGSIENNFEDRDSMYNTRNVEVRHRRTKTTIKA